MRSVIAVSACVAGALIWGQFFMSQEESRSEVVESLQFSSRPLPADRALDVVDGLASPGTAGAELVERTYLSSQRDVAEERSEADQVYTGEAFILGDPSDPEDNLEGVATYSGPQFILGEPTDPNEGDVLGGTFSDNPVQLGEYVDPSAPSDPYEQSFATPIVLGEYTDPDAQYVFPAEYEKIELGEASEPDDP